MVTTTNGVRFGAETPPPAVECLCLVKVIGQPERLINIPRSCIIWVVHNYVIPGGNCTLYDVQTKLRPRGMYYEASVHTHWMRHQMVAEWTVRTAEVSGYILPKCIVCILHVVCASCFLCIVCILPMYPLHLSHVSCASFLYILCIFLMYPVQWRI